MIPAPKSRLRRIAEGPYSYEIGVALFIVFGQLANTFRGFESNPGHIVGWFWLLSAIGVLTLSIIKIVLQWLRHEERKSTHDLAGCLHVLHSILMSKHTGDDGRLRLTLYLPVNNGEELEQLLEYIGAEYPGRKKGRRFPSSVGIIGRAFRLQEPFAADRRNPDPKLFVKELIEDWGYTEKSAREIDDSSQCWLAIPLGGGSDKLYGILYADSDVEGFFDEDAVETVLTASLGIVDFIVERYRET